MKTSYTPGPWQVENGIVHIPHKTTHGGSYIYITSPITVRTATMTGNENNANAHLIAAAPELLEACELFVTAIETLGKPSIADAGMAIRAAIAKARGQA
jgi:hypothetical protein